MTGPNAPDVEFVDWETVDSRDGTAGWHSLVTPLAFAAYLLAWTYDALGRPDHVPLIDLETGFTVGGRPVGLELAPGNVEWLFGLTVGCWLRFVGVPLWRNERLRRYYWLRIRRNRVAVWSAWVLLGVFALGLVGPILVGDPEANWRLGTVAPVGFGGTWAHPLGTTQNGTDVLAITVAGARVSVMVGVIATTVAIGLATAVGTTAAFLGGRVDALLMRTVDLLMTIPTFFLLLFLVYVYGGDLFAFVCILGLTTWGGQARLVRSEALQRVQEPYVDVARAVGATRAFVLRRHLASNVSNTVVTAATLHFPAVILFEAVVSFLGFGDPTVWSWGRAIDEGTVALASAWWVSTVPGVALFVTVLAFNFLGDALRDALDPRHEVSRSR